MKNSITWRMWLHRMVEQMPFLRALKYYMPIYVVVKGFIHFFHSTGLIEYISAYLFSCHFHLHRFRRYILVGNGAESLHHIRRPMAPCTS